MSEEEGVGSDRFSRGFSEQMSKMFVVGHGRVSDEGAKGDAG